MPRATPLAQASQIQGRLHTAGTRPAAASALRPPPARPPAAPPAARGPRPARRRPLRAWPTAGGRHARARVAARRQASLLRAAAVSKGCQAASLRRKGGPPTAHPRLELRVGVRRRRRVRRRLLGRAPRERKRGARLCMRGLGGAAAGLGRIQAAAQVAQLRVRLDKPEGQGAPGRAKLAMRAAPCMRKPGAQSKVMPPGDQLAPATQHPGRATHWLRSLLSVARLSSASCSPSLRAAARSACSCWSSAACGKGQRV